MHMIWIVQAGANSYEITHTHTLSWNIPWLVRISKCQEREASQPALENAKVAETCHGYRWYDSWYMKPVATQFVQ